VGFGKAARLAARLPHACASSSQRRATQRAQIAAPRARQPLSSPGPRPAAPCPPCGRPPLARPARPHRQEAASVRSCFSCCTVTCAFAYEQLRSPASASCQASELTTGVTHGTRDDDRRTERSSRAASRGVCSERGFSRGAVTQGVRLARPTGEAHAGSSDWPCRPSTMSGRQTTCRAGARARQTRTSSCRSKTADRYVPDRQRSGLAPQALPAAAAACAGASGPAAAAVAAAPLPLPASRESMTRLLATISRCVCWCSCAPRARAGQHSARRLPTLRQWPSAGLGASEAQRTACDEPHLPKLAWPSVCSFSPAVTLG